MLCEYSKFQLPTEHVSRVDGVPAIGLKMWYPVSQMCELFE